MTMIGPNVQTRGKLSVIEFHVLSSLSLYHVPPNYSFMHKSGDRYHPYSQQSSHRSHGQSDDRQKNDRQGSDRQSDGGILVLDATKGTEVSNPTDLPTRVNHLK
ncbi:hypothetical protein Tco_1296445 [Tanacetum coccineum]